MSFAYVMTNSHISRALLKFAVNTEVLTVNLLPKINPFERVVLDAAAEVSVETGIDSYAVGGHVRDLLLNRPTKDIDIVCVGSGIEFAKQVAQKFTPVPKVAY